ncbi:hypothetical protein SLS62_007205 [Diatrype stigma]|uniref:Histidinol-phosphatase n=1 Tax=Diatrype stigma TaxID=117547 RepID=A0AAN9UN07_9PEZI
MHSHSGQFCPGHAKDQLEDVIKHAISIGYTTIGLTEHMPRTHLEDLYPEEATLLTNNILQLDDPEASLAVLAPRHEAYLVEAKRLQEAYASQLHILIGFEGEWMRSAYGPLIESLSSHPSIDYFIGSLHHVKGVPIDYDAAYYRKALEAAGSTEEEMYERYYDEQFEMLQALRPRIVGHFDLIRLLSSNPGFDVREWKGVWERIMRNLEFVASYEGWLECNSSALRKGLQEPYPCRIIAKEWIKLGGQFTLSDDSHGIAQVGTNYGRALDFLTSLGVSSVFTLERHPHPGTTGDQKSTIVKKEVPIASIKEVVSKWQ